MDQATPARVLGRLWPARPAKRRGHFATRGLRALTTHWRAIGITLSALVAAVSFLVWVDRFYDIQRWLFWRYAGATFGASTWGLSCLCVGHRVLRTLVTAPLRFADEVAIAFPLGLLVFGGGVFSLGLVGALSPWAFFAWPLLLLATGRPLLRCSRRYLRHLRARRHSPPLTVVSVLVVLGSTFGFLLLYYPTLDPATVMHDARWYHLAMAEHYVADGAISRFPEGWILGAFPQLATYFYTWAFLAPNASLFDRVVLCSHMELVAVVFTIAAIPSLVRFLLHGKRAPLSFAFFFAFPGIYLYDSNLCVGADRMAAAFAVPIVLTLSRFLRSFRGGDGALAGACLAGPLVVKYSAVILVVFPALVVTGAMLKHAVTSRSTGHRHWKRGALALVGTALIVTSIHWLKNWLWYGDPLYPILRDFLHVEPWGREAEATYRSLEGMRFGPRDGVRGVVDGLRAMFTFSFVPHDWYVFHRNWPTFGSLFTLTLPLLPFLPRPGRTLALQAAALVGIFVWYEIHHQDRYLQAIFPWMVAATAAAIVAAWRMRNRWVNGSIAALVGAQLVWGLDVPFFPTHNQIEDSMIRHASTHFASGFTRTKKRLELYGPMPAIGRRLKPNDRVLIHDQPMHLGTGRATVQDYWQGRISYSELATPARVHDELRALGVTAVVWEREVAHGHLPLASDLVFFEFVSRHVVDERHVDQMSVARLPAERPSPTSENRWVAVYSCKKSLRSGWYALQDLADFRRKKPRERVPKSNSASGEDFEEADFLVWDAKCHGEIPEELAEVFERVAQRDGVELRVR